MTERFCDVWRSGLLSILDKIGFDRASLVNPPEDACEQP
jgi:hypothetical protein